MFQTTTLEAEQGPNLNNKIILNNKNPIFHLQRNQIMVELQQSKLKKMKVKR
jgi:hypothetical protein